MPQANGPYYVFQSPHPNLARATTEAITESIETEPTFGTNSTSALDKVLSTSKQSHLTKHKAITLVRLYVDFKNGYKATRTGGTLFWTTIALELQKKINKNPPFTSDSARIKMKDLLNSYRNWKVGIKTSGAYNTDAEFECAIEKWHNHIKEYEEEILGSKKFLEELKAEATEAKQIKDDMFLNLTDQAKAKSKHQAIKKRQ